MKIRIMVGVLAAFGVGLIAGALAAQSLRTFSEVPASTYAAAGLIPAMLVGQLIISRKRSRR